MIEVSPSDQLGAKVILGSQDLMDVTSMKSNRLFILLRKRLAPLPFSSFKSFSIASSTLDFDSSDKTRSTVPMLRSSAKGIIKRGAPDPVDLSDTSESNSEIPLAKSEFVKGQEVSIKVLQFGPLGASVSVFDRNGEAKARGLVIQSEIAMLRDKRDGEDVVIGEVLAGFIGQVRDDGKLNISLRPIGSSRIDSAKKVVLDALEGSPSGTIPVGDKSSSEDISAYFHGMSKSDFKIAVGSLFKEGLAKPGSFITTVTSDTEREAVKAKGVNPRGIFIGNLPTTITEENLKKAINGKMGKDSVLKIRLALDSNNKPRGFAYVDMRNSDLAKTAVTDLKGIEINGRKIRTDFATNRKPAEDVSEDELALLALDPGVGKVTAVKKDRVALQAPANSVDDVDDFLADILSDNVASTPTSISGRSSSSPSLSNTQSERQFTPSTAHRSATATVTSSDAPYRRRTTSDGSIDRSKSWSDDAKRAIARRASLGSAGSSDGGPQEVRRDRSTGGFKYTMFVGNLAYKVTEDLLKVELERRLNAAGAVAQARIITDEETGRKKGYGYVDFLDEEVFRGALQSLQGADLLGRPMRLDDATKEGRAPSSNGSNRSYRR